MSRYDAALNLPLLQAGKVRELYEYSPTEILMVATDAISAFDHVLDSVIPDKGKVLTQLSIWWLNQLSEAGSVPNHLVSTEVPEAVAGRAIIVRKLQMIDVECVARGYLTGSGWNEYQATGSVCGIRLPAGLKDGSPLPDVIFTPARKMPQGSHDENVDYATLSAHLGDELAGELATRTARLYQAGADLAAQRGFVLADTKFEFGLDETGQVVLADEVLTPDSSRFWDGAAYGRGELVSFDKQYVRNWLLQESGWDRNSDTPPPALPPEVIAGTRQRYIDAFEQLTKTPFSV